jgi:NAD-dependent histone deacetylase SIR2
MLDEGHPQGDVIGSIIRRDCAARTRVLLILGTSLKVDGPRRLATQFARQIRRRGGKVVYVNRTEPGSAWRNLIDYWVRWDCDLWVADLVLRQSVGSRRENPIIID